MPTDKMIVLNLTGKQFEKLSEILLDAQDEGPIDEGWASPELQELRDLVKAAQPTPKG